MASRRRRTFQIVQGPDRLDILMAFAHYGKHANRGPMDAVLNSKDIVYFVSTDVHVRYEGSADPDRRLEVKFYMTISAIEQADATGRNWEIKGRLMAASPLPYQLEVGTENARHVLVQYGTANKKGTLYVLADN